jgi:hypothetical protein
MFNYNEPNKIYNINPSEGFKKIQQMNDVVESGSLQEFLDFAKTYNIFQESNNKFYKSMCEKIRQRLIKENLTEDDVRPGE